jgi:opacity protein-like surface antigen
MIKCVTAIVIATLPTLFVFADSGDGGNAVVYSAEQKQKVNVYLAAFGGSDFAQDYGNGQIKETGFGTTFPFKGSGGSSVGGAGGVKAGYSFAPFPSGGSLALGGAVEVEAFYLGANPKLHSSYAPGDSFTLQGDLNNAAFMVNGVLRLETGTIFTPYVGAGVGGEYLDFTNPHSNEQAVGLETFAHGADDLCFAVQGLAGFDIRVSNGWSLFTEYKFVAAIDPSFDFGSYTFPGNNGPYDIKFAPDYIGQNLITCGVKYNF